MSIMKSGESMSMMRKALNHSWAFVRHLGRFSFKDNIKHDSKVIHRKFRIKKKEVQIIEENKWKKVLYWTLIIAIPLSSLILCALFFEAGKFFLKTPGNELDTGKIFIMPALAALMLLSWFIYSLYKNSKLKSSKKRRFKHIKLLFRKKSKSHQELVK